MPGILVGNVLWKQGSMIFDSTKNQAALSFLASVPVGVDCSSRDKLGFWVVSQYRISKLESCGDHLAQYLKDKDPEAREMFNFVTLDQGWI